ncbi:MAG: beta-ketoacyl synthase N-terminal-like domain-containing protein, partial [Pseudomonadota bacterium]|nr:beta-ketoacyl synthase N-terminal-like domain-containing protein [Pseudomonadota bacterium]
MKTKRVVITGLGTVNPCGLNAPDTWKAILAGESGIGPITGFDTTGYSVDFGGEVKGFCADDVLSAKESRKLDPFIQYALVAA